MQNKQIFFLQLLRKVSAQAVAVGLSVETRTYIHGLVVVVVLIERIIRVHVGGGVRKG